MLKKENQQRERLQKEKLLKENQQRERLQREKLLKESRQREKLLKKGNQQKEERNKRIRLVLKDSYLRKEVNLQNFSSFNFRLALFRKYEQKFSLTPYFYIYSSFPRDFTFFEN